MSGSAFQVPNEMRVLAERSLEQARKTFEGFLAAAQQAAGGAGSGGAKSLAAQALANTEANMNAAFELAGKLIHAKDPQEAYALQSEYLKGQVATLQAQAKELGAAFQKSLVPGSK